jgi:SAM-dependent methyltransferase
METKVKLNLGCGTKLLPGYINCDLSANVTADRHFDLDHVPYPFADSSVDEVLMDQVLEHLTDVVAVIQELHRILKPGGIVDIYVPYAKSDWAVSDPTHKHYFTERSMDYFTDNFVCNFYSDARFRILNKDLISGKNSFKNRVRDLIPFKGLLRYFFWNIYDGIHFRMECLKNGPAS